MVLVNLTTVHSRLQLELKKEKDAQNVGEHELVIKYIFTVILGIYWGSPKDLQVDRDQWVDDPGSIRTRQLQ